VSNPTSSNIANGVVKAVLVLALCAFSVWLLVVSLADPGRTRSTVHTTVAPSSARCDEYHAQLDALEITYPGEITAEQRALCQRTR